jgi:hypothetical protein
VLSLSAIGIASVVLQRVARRRGTGETAARELVRFEI